MPEESRAAYLARKHHDDYWGKAPEAEPPVKLSRAAMLAQKYHEQRYGKPEGRDVAINIAATILNAIDP